MATRFDDREWDVVPSSPVLNSHGAELYPLAVSRVEMDDVPTATRGEEYSEAHFGQWVRLNPSEGGEMGSHDRLSYRTGMVARSARTYPFSGRMLVAPRQLAHDAVGEVGVDGARDRLYSGVQAQQTDYTPSAVDIARGFLSMRGARGVQTTVNDGLI